LAFFKTILFGSYWCD